MPESLKDAIDQAAAELPDDIFIRTRFHAHVEGGLAAVIEKSGDPNLITAAVQAIDRAEEYARQG